MEYEINAKRTLGGISPMIYGHFIEHFHRQIYDGIFDPENQLSDGDGFRTDIIEAMKRIRVPIMRWPGGCFVSSYHWRDGVGAVRQPAFDKAWRVEDPNTFGTDEFIKLCRKIGCEPYICTNAGTGTAEEMSDWVEYCNLDNEGKNAKLRIANGYSRPYRVRYWSIGNENYGAWEIGAKSADEWGRLTAESAKMMKHVDPEIELSAAALADINWNVNLLRSCGQYLDWISVHQYWDMMPEVNYPADYGACMAFTSNIGRAVDEVRGILTAMRLEKKIKIAFDEWNLRSWHHPNVHTVVQGKRREDYITPRDKNDDNSTYTMADAVFSACFLNEMIRNCDIVGMANFAPILNTRGCIYSYRDGIVLRGTYYVFMLFTEFMNGEAVDVWGDGEPELMEVTSKSSRRVSVRTVDIAAARTADGGVSVSLVNKHPTDEKTVTLRLPGVFGRAVMYTLNGDSVDSYNDVGREEINVTEREAGDVNGTVSVELDAHSVNILRISKA